MEIQPLARQVFIDKLEIIKFESPRLTFIVNCSKGTYVRTICHDLGEALGVGGHMSFLLRTRVGNFTLAESVTLEEIINSKEKALRPLEFCVQGLTQVVLTEKEIEKIKQGQLLSIDQAKCALAISRENIVPENLSPEALSPTVPVIEAAGVLNEKGKLQAIVAVFKRNNELILKPKKVFNRE